MERKLISIVVPVFNEEENIFPLYEALKPVIESCSVKYDFEFVFTDNHSTDSTYTKLLSLAALDSRVRIFRFSRNFGYQKSILTGYFKANGNALIQFDCDLQDPPELIPQFIAQWESGCDVVYGIRRTRKESRLINLLRKSFYRLANWLSEDDLPVDVGDFRLIDQKIVAVLKQTDDAQPYLRGMISAMGFKQSGIPYERAERLRGQSNFKFKDLVSLAMDGILNHSIVPLRVASYCGVIISGLTIFAIIIYSISRVFLHVTWPAGFTTLAVLILFGISLNALFLGIIGEYLGRIYQQVKKKPLVIIERTVDRSSKE